MQRILVIGTTGSGKSTLAQALAEKLNLKYADGDDFYYLPGWQERPTPEFRVLIDAATKGDRWVVAGNHFAKGAAISWPRADTVIWLDLPFWQNFRQLFVRTLRRLITREAVCNGNYESLYLQLCTKQSLFLWFFRSWGRNRERLGQIFAKPGKHPHIKFIRLRSRAEIKAFMESLG
jgi:adenylate kinase family enzyme